MNDTKWVQHISGQGKKWKNVSSFYGSSQWMVEAEMNGNHHFLPKSEYVPCDPPEKVVDVTAQCEAYGASIAHNTQIIGYNCYNLRKVKLYKAESSSVKNCEQWAFIVERKELP
jgi:hypothetical protein